jgi:hypothetical protein
MRTRIFIGFCLGILFFSCSPKKENNTLSFVEIAPIIHEHCTNCHNPNGAGPFNLISYHDVFQRAKMIAAVTRTGFMPPWPADTNYSHFAGEKKLSKADIELLQKWVQEGAIAGDTSLIKTPNEVLYSTKRKPDMVLPMVKSLAIPGDAQDRFLLMKIPYEIPQDKYVEAIEFVPGQKKLIHHVNGELLMYDENKRKDVYRGDMTADINDFENVLQAYEKMQLAQDDGSYPTMKLSVVNYLPGVEGFGYPKGIGGFLMPRKGAYFFKDIHYGPATKDLRDSSKLNIWFTDEKPKRITYEMQMGTLGISFIEPALVIPPNEVKRFKTQLTITGDMSMLTINPHMHLLGTKFWAYAVKPDGDTIPLIRINKWDFRWQYFYTFKKMLHLPKGTTIYAWGEFDNTINNPLNPNHPPKTVSEKKGSMRTSDEMFQFIITYLPYQIGDENISLE